MTKRKNMTPEDEAEWIARELVRKREQKRRRAATPEGRAHLAEIRRRHHAKMQATNPSYVAEARARVKRNLAKNPAYRERKREAEIKRKRHIREAKRTEAQYEAFMARLEAGNEIDSGSE